MVVCVIMEDDIKWHKTNGDGKKTIPDGPFVAEKNPSDSIR